MKIIIYNPHTKEWNEFINSLGCKREERDNAIKDHIAEIGQEVSTMEFVNNSHLYTNLFGELRYKFIGEPNNPLEKLVRFVYSGSNYINMKKKFPEDFIESRTDWYDMANYADEMASFIEEIMEDMTEDTGLTTKIATLKEVAKEYPGRTIENIITNLKARLPYAADNTTSANG